MMTIQLLKSNAINKIKLSLDNENGVRDFYLPEVRFDKTDLWNSSLKIKDDDAPQLSRDVAEDWKNAIRVHSWLGELNNVIASDARLWSYLALVTFREYVQKRWPLPGKNGPTNSKDRDEAMRIISERWLVRSTDSRALRRHAIARLWWAANLTVAPWEKDKKRFSHLEQEDRYTYTKMLLSSETLYLDLVERNFSRPQSILIATLEYLRRNPNQMKSREAVRGLMKELNLYSGVKNLSILSQPEIEEFIEKI